MTLRNPSRRRRGGGGRGGSLKAFGQAMAGSIVPAGVVIVGLLGPAIAVDFVVNRGWIDEKNFVDDQGNPDWKRYLAEGLVVGAGWFAARKFKGGKYAQLVAISGLAGIGVRAYMNSKDASNEADELSLATWGQGAAIAAKGSQQQLSSGSGSVGTITRIDRGRLGTVERVSNF